MSKATCSIEGCDKPSRSRGWCSTHYGRYTRHGDPLAVQRLWIRDPLESWLARVEKTDSCWLWRGHVMPNGYGAGRGGLAHRVGWELLRGPIPEGLVIDHLCRVKRCVNPDHLEVVTQQENQRRGTSPASIAANRNCCGRGHEYTEENLYVYRGKRRCRRCARDYHQQRKQSSAS